MNKKSKEHFYFQDCTYYMTHKGYCYVYIYSKHGDMTKRISQDHYTNMKTQKHGG